MFRIALRPSPLGLALRIVVVALWTALWIVALAQLLKGPETAARQPGPNPELARVETASAAKGLTA